MSWIEEGEERSSEEEADFDSRTHSLGKRLWFWGIGILENRKGNGQGSLRSRGCEVFVGDSTIRFILSCLAFGNWIPNLSIDAS